MFDRLEWWQVIGLLAPLVAVMQFIRMRELAAVSTGFAQLSAAQRGWVLMTLLPPGTTSRLLLAMPVETRSGYIEAGSTIKGSGRNLIKPVVRFAVSRLPADLKKQAGSSLDENLSRLTRWADAEPEEFLSWLHEQCPPPAIPAPALA